jgi:energy-coupling factor transporter ATP-binding protein EcfA2
VIRSLEMLEFRGVHSGTLEGLTALVVLVGPNSSGKSTVLDALMIGGASSPANATTEAARRRRALRPQGRLADDADYESLFYKGSLFADIRVKSERGARRVVLRNRLPGAHVEVDTSANSLPAGWGLTAEQFKVTAKNDPTPLTSVREVAIVDSRDLTGARTLEELYTLTSQRGLRKEVKAFITEMLPDVEDLEILAPKNVPTLHLNFEDHALPIGLAGDGVQLLLRLVMALTAVPKTTVLLEEPETHMHPGAIRLIAQAVHTAIARGVQVVLTTHSLELIDALTLGRPDEELQRISVFRLALERGVLKSTRLDGQEVALARSSIEDDLR